MGNTFTNEETKTTYIKKEVKEYFTNRLGALVVVFTDGSRTIYYND